MLEECLAEDEETNFRSEAAELRVDGWFGGSSRISGETDEKW